MRATSAERTGMPAPRPISSGKLELCVETTGELDDGETEAPWVAVEPEVLDCGELETVVEAVAVDSVVAVVDFVIIVVDGTGV